MTYFNTAITNFAPETLYVTWTIPAFEEPVVGSEEWFAKLAREGRAKQIARKGVGYRGAGRRLALQKRIEFKARSSPGTAGS